MKVKAQNRRKDQKKLRIYFIKTLILNAKNNMLKGYHTSFWKYTPFTQTIPIDLDSLPFEKVEIEEVLIILLNEENITLNDLEMIGIPNDFIDYVSARRWFTKKEIQDISHMPDDYSKAITIIGRIYGEKMDRSGNPQSRHLIAVSNRMKTKKGKVVGLLHDVVEDGYLTLMSLLCLFIISSSTVQEVRVLTRDKKMHPTYDSYIRNQVLLSRSLLVLEAKDNDMINNQSPERVLCLPTQEEQEKALAKYKPYIPLVKKRIHDLKLERKR